MNQPPVTRNPAANQRKRSPALVVTDSELSRAAYRQAMALYDRCVRHAAILRLRKDERR
jgi:hypothetical protein